MPNALKTALGSIVAVLVAAGAGTASAQTPGGYSIAGASCVPVGQTSTAHKVFNVAGDVGFATGALGDIILTCPVNPTLQSAAFLEFLYRDADGPGVAGRVSAVLRRKNLQNGGVGNVGQTVNSNLLPPVPNYGPMRASLASNCNSHIFDFNNYAYFIQVTLNRTTTTQAPLFAGARVVSIVC